MNELTGALNSRDYTINLQYLRQNRYVVKHVYHNFIAFYGNLHLRGKIFVPNFRRNSQV